MQPLVGLGGEMLAGAQLSTQVFRCIRAQVAKRHMNGAGWTHDRSNVVIVVGVLFPNMHPMVATRLISA
jgi:hypothetical protein